MNKNRNFTSRFLDLGENPKIGGFLIFFSESAREVCVLSSNTERTVDVYLSYNFQLPAMFRSSARGPGVGRNSVSTFKPRY